MNVSHTIVLFLIALNQSCTDIRMYINDKKVRMFCFPLALVFNLGLQTQLKAQPYSIPVHVKRIVFLGNSITYDGRFIEYMDTYFSIHKSDSPYEVINVGLPSETVSGLSEPNHADGKFPRPDLHERLQRVLEQTEPDLIFASYGMNDGIYLPFDEDRFNRFKEGIEWLHQELEKVDVHTIHITPSIFDERKGNAYANVLDIYSDWLISKRYTNDWNVIDVHWPMRKKQEDLRLADSTFTFAQDGVHPTEHGHFFIAKQILLGLGESRVIAFENKDDLIASHPHGAKILELVQDKQRMTKDAWLTSTGHKRPGMKEGIPIEKALEKWEVIGKQIKMLLYP